MHTAFDDVSLAPMIAPTVGAAPELERLGDEIAERSARLDPATARLLDLIREFDARGGWGNGSGFRSGAHWLTWRVGLDPGAARERVRVARALGTLPRLAEALARGELSYSKVRALTRVATPETEERLLRVGRAGTAEHVEQIVRGWRRVDRIAEAKQGIQRHRSRGLHVYQDEDGMVVVRGRLEPETGAVLMKALEAARETIYERARNSGVINKNVSAETLHPETGLLVCEDTPTWGQQQADALALLAETALHHGIDPGTPGERYQVVVHVDASVLAESDAPATPDASAAPDAHGQSVLEDGAHVSYETSPASGRPFRDDDVVAEPFEAADVVTADARGVAALEVVGPEVVVGDAMLEHVPEGHDHRVLHGHDGLLGAAPGFEPVIERAVVTLLTPDGGPSRLLQGRPQPGGSLARGGVLPLPRALMIAGT